MGGNDGYENGGASLLLQLGYGQFSAAQLKIIQEVISLTVFSIFSVTFLKETLRWNYIVAFVLIIAAVFFVFLGKEQSAAREAVSVGTSLL